MLALADEDTQAVWGEKGQRSQSWAVAKLGCEPRRQGAGPMLSPTGP